MDNLTAYYLMNGQMPRRKSPMEMFAQNFTAGLPAQGQMGGGIWEEIGDFLNGRARKGKMTKMDQGEGKSWFNPMDSETSTSIADPYGGGVF